ncbi:MAG: ABC transporter substrate-binding protein [Clostridia bacterium]|nr:ABC transporter substrate-binding protein [Clostridia bacterium]
MKRILSLALALLMLVGMIPMASAETAAYTQSPYLDGKELPAVADRLPIASDVMVEEMKEIGQYGGALTLLQGGSSKWGPGKPTEEALFRFNTDGTIEPNVAKGYDVNEDATVYTIYLREGMKWSDGVPFTSEDCRFFYEDLLIPGVTTKSVWEAMYSSDANGEDKTMATLEIVDDYTFKVVFKYPKPNFLKELAINGKWFFAPKHWLQDKIPGENYLSQEEADKLAAELGYSDVKSMGNSLTYYYWIVPGRPTLRAWTIQGDFEAELCTWVRNPYYWKVDAEGKQLPYIDELHFRRYSDAEQALLWTLDGTADISSVALADVETILNDATAAVELIEWSSVDWASNSIQLNQAIKDEDLRALFQNVKFRQALSIAVNREQIVELVDNGYTEAAQSAPAAGAQGYSEEWTKAYTQYDVAAAQALLEECGLVKGDDGFYYFANGKKVVLNLQYQDETHASLAELLKNDFTILGLETTTRMYDRSIMEEMRSANNHEVVINYESFSTVSLSLRPDYFVPFRDYCIWGTAFGLWYKNPANEAAVEPPADVKAMLETYDKMMAATTVEKRDEIAGELLAMFKDGLYEIGFSSALPAVYAIDANLRNFPDVAVDCDEFRNLGIANFAQLWLAAE